MLQRMVWLSVFFGVIANRVAVGEMPWVRVADDKHGFVLSDSAKPFVPWGFNYDHDENGRLLEDYWDKEWPKVEEDFREMKQLGANVVRIHLQIAKFMTGPEKTNEANLDRLGRLVALAEKTGIYLDITGLACYRKKDVPEVVRRSLTKRTGGMSRPGSGRRWPSDAPRARPSSATT